LQKEALEEEDRQKLALLAIKAREDKEKDDEDAKLRKAALDE